MFLLGLGAEWLQKEYTKRDGKRKNSMIPMLVGTVNNSIGNEKNHFTAKSLKELFFKKGNFTSLDRYAIDIIQTEATKSEIDCFAKNYQILEKNISYRATCKFKHYKQLMFPHNNFLRLKKSL